MPARQEGAPHLDLARFQLSKLTLPHLRLLTLSAPSSRPLLALPPPSSPRTSPSERTERGAEDEGRCSFSLSRLTSLDYAFLSRLLTKALDDKEATAGRGARPRISTPASYGAISAERGNFHEQERQGGIRRPRAQVQQSNGEPQAAVSLVPPPPHVRILANFIRLLPLASYCADETERRASAAPKATEIHKTRNPRPFTGPFFGPYMHPNRPLDLKIVFNQHPKPPNGITNVFRFRAHSGVVNFLFPFR